MEDEPGEFCAGRSQVGFSQGRLLGCVPTRLGWEITPTTGSQQDKHSPEDLVHSINLERRLIARVKLNAGVPWASLMTLPYSHQ